MMLHSTEQVGLSPAWCLVIEGHHNLLEQGRAPDERGPLPTAWSDLAVYATAPTHDVIGVVSWKPVPERGEADITLIYVEPSSRRLGVFTAMWQATIRQVADRKITRLRLRAVHGDSLAIKMFEKLGAAPMVFECKMTLPSMTAYDQDVAKQS